MAGSIMQYVLYLAVLVVLAPVRTYMKKVMYGEKTIFSLNFHTPANGLYAKSFMCKRVRI